MKKLFIIVSLVSFMLSTSIQDVLAQNEYYKWGIRTGIEALDFGTPNGKGISRDNMPLGFNFGVIRHLTPSFNARLSLRANPAGNLPIEGVLSDISNLFDVSLDVEYKFANGYILPVNSWFEPYVFAGGGVIETGNTLGKINAGLGFNFWFDKGMAVFVETNYNLIPSDKLDNYMQHSAGFRWRIGKGNDSDGDGISDDKDKCPNEAGLKQFGGCPDSDNDGIPNNEDACPNEAGLAELQGCPDSDGDGIADKDDQCPNEAGLAELQGCPDKDGDGVADKDDRCPDVAGLKDFKGCPDSDGDGVPNIDDQCPNEAGVKSLAGCPDRDGDGVADKDDKCPDEAGPKNNNGCPIPVAEIEKELEMDAKQIQFETARAVIRKESFEALDKVVELMKEYPNSKFSIEGHSDNVGNAANNKILSQQRSDAVKKYFIDKGISAERLTSVGYGQEKPIATNTTAAGRAQNRRVEIHLEK